MPAGVEVIRAWPLPPGTIPTVPVAPGGGGVAVEQPVRLAKVEVAEPSFTCTMQPVPWSKELFWILKLPALSLAPMATPFTVIVRLAIAVPSIRSCLPLSSARETLTAASATAGAAMAGDEDEHGDGGETGRPPLLRSSRWAQSSHGINFRVGCRGPSVRGAACSTP